MLKLKTLSTGSLGNCYLLSTEEETLIMDCGIGIKDIKRGLDYDLSQIQGVIVTHGHVDHVKSAEDFKSMGFEVWQPYQSENKRQMKKFGSFTVQSFEVPHDNEPCVAYFIKVNGHKLLYATDFEYIGMSFRNIGLNTLLIECNYQKELVDKEADNRNHVLRGHAELQTTLGVIKDNNSDSLKNVLLCHLSNRNAMPSECVNEVQKIVNKDVYVDYCRKDFEIILNE